MILPPHLLLIPPSFPFLVSWFTPAELGVTTEVAMGIFQSAKVALSEGGAGKGAKPQSALELLQQEKLRKPISTLSHGIDRMLGGGVPLARVTEFCGIPGSGKTQVAIQLAVSTQLPSNLANGVEGEVVYFDTEGGLTAERVTEVAEGTARRLSAEVTGQEARRGLEAHLATNAVLSRIHCYRVHDYVELVALLNVMEDFLAAHPKVKLVVVDAISSHFRADFTDLTLRTRLLGGLAQQLTGLAERFQLAVVLMNQMTTKITGQAEAMTSGTTTGADNSVVIPALGDSWGHACTNRLILYWQDGQRNAQLFKSPANQERVVRFQITKDGIQDVEEAQDGQGKRKRLQTASFEKQKKM